ncbi:MAG: hypothetical protein QOK16_3782 [Solirubrobacteraceae bacterium]|jgi:hypothetical protein|nr:hypothetical protein [Solirubrobacteraceae bacterium]
MDSSGLRSESVYFEDRAERLLRELRAAHGVSRRHLLQLAAAGLSLLADRRAAPARAQTIPAAAASPIVKPLRPEWFVNFGSNAEMRWDAA